MRTSVPFLLGLGIVLGLFSYNVFTSLPYLQHEIVGIAHWWTHPEIGFFETLFDGVKMDSAPGRFRYLEYLTEAAYWKSMANGLLPYDFYDYFGFLSVLIITSFLWRIAKEKQLGTTQTFLCLAFFILSSNSFLITVFQFRKAKALTALLFAAVLLLVSKSNPTRKHFWGLGILGLIGFLTDPFFVVGAPTFVFCSDLPAKKFKRTAALIGGFFAAVPLVLFLNGVVGPNFSKNAQILFGGFKDQTAIELLNWRNITAFPRVLQELVVPGFILEPVWAWERELLRPGILTETSWLGWALIFSLMGLVFFQFRKSLSGWGLSLGFLFMMPICAFLIVPISTRALYSGYYGFPLIVLLTVVLMDLLFLLRSYSPLVLKTGLLSLLLVISIHQINQKRVRTAWIEHSLFPIQKEKYFNDYEKIKTIAQFFRENPKATFELKLPRAVMLTNLGQGWYAHSSQEHTDLLNVMVPLIFRKPLEEKRLVYKFEKNDTPYPPRAIIWSDTLRYPYHSGPVPKGSLIDIRWVTSNTTKCLMDPGGSTETIVGAVKVKIDKPTLVHLECEGEGGKLEQAFTISPIEPKT